MQGAEDKDIERKAEQLYFDSALEHRERRREHLGDLPGAGIHKGAVEGLRHISEETKRQLRGPEDAVAFGRIDFEGNGKPGDTFYIGHNAIWDEDTQDVLVVNWRADVASPYYAATHKDAHGLARKRSFFCESNTIVDFDDVVFAELAARVAALGLAEPEPDDHLLRELARNRTGEMQEIVRTIQAAQYEIIRAPFDQLLVVQGGPGTGKTALALHRVSWLLYNQSGIGARDVLVVGPNPTFVRYIRSVLPSLGDRDVRHTDIGDLGAVPVRLGRDEDRAVVQLKGDRRMAGLLDRALQQRIRVPAEGIAIGEGRSTVKLSAEELTSIVDRLRSRPYAAGRVGLRERLRALAGVETGEAVESIVDRVWPNLTVPQFLQELLGSQNRLLEAAGDEFSAREVQTLYRQAAQRVTDEVWSSADVPLLHHAHARISDEAGDRFGHIVVDEAQDLSPMQLAMVARRSSNGSMTVLGDVAQSTGPWARDDWSDVIAALARDRVDANVEELEVGYRVPRPAFELAVRVLGDAAPGVRMPRVVREGPEPELVEVMEPEQLVAGVVSAARAFAGDGHLVGVICPEALRESTIAGFRSSGVRIAEARRDGLGAAITVVSPVEAKGLEFDAVVVVEPAVIVGEDAHGRRQLFIALTRTTGHLAVVHAEPFLDETGDDVVPSIVDEGEVDEQSPTQVQPEEPRAADADAQRPARVDAATKAIARHFVEEIRSVVREDQIEAVLRAIREELDRA
ncbi:MAG: AAA family ATPase [Actinomycetota bacterium]|nr:AAA family ATPase [Actinomycetota bacterium]